MWVGPTTAPIGPISPGARRAFHSPISTSSSSSTLRPAASPRRLHRPAFGVGRPRDDEKTATGLVGPRHERPHGPQTEIGVDGEGVGPERGVGSEECFGIGVIRRPHVAALGVHDDQQPGTAGLGDQPLQGTNSAPPVALVEGGLGLDQTDRPHRRVESDLLEAVQSVGCIPDSPLVEYRPGRVEPPRQRAMLGSHRSEPGGEGVGHALILTHGRQTSQATHTEPQGFAKPGSSG